MRRRLFNLFAFTCLAFALYLITSSKEESNQPSRSTSQTAHSVSDAKTASTNNAH
jgi:hypothetical protein